MATINSLPRPPLFDFTVYQGWHILGVSFAQFVHSSDDASIFLDLDFWFFGIRILVWFKQGKATYETRT
jgi:hypothetical protein